MPLIRKPADTRPPSRPEAATVLKALTSAHQEERWAAARSAAELPGGVAALAAALRTEHDARVREAMFTGLARAGTPEGIQEIIAFLRSDNAGLRTAALDALRAAAGAVHTVVPQLLNDADPDIRILSCELARSLPAAEAASLLCALIGRERQVNVCAAAIDVLAEVGTTEALPALSECAQRFGEAPFLAFAVKIAIDRIHSQSTLGRE